MVKQFYLCVLMTALAVVSAGAQERGLVAHWTMDEAREGVVADASGRGHDATFTAAGGAQPVFVPGAIGKALKLREGDQAYLTVAKPEELMPPKGLTVMAWVKPAARSKSYEILACKGDKSGEPPWPGWRLRFAWTRATFEYGTAEGKEPRTSSAEWSVPAGFWTHVAAVHDGQSIRVFVNGVEQASAPAEGGILPARRGLVIGNYIGRKNAYAFDGLLDDLKLFNRALTADEIFRESVAGLP